ncbi:MAG: flagellar biosynthesis protein FlhB [Clostridiales bacterium]|nr:flagellar biosynthesis protein FlhB [Clostridiales bacterium]
MADGGTGEKTEKATPKKRKDERKKGNVFSSRDIVTVASILVMFFAIRLWFPTMREHMDSFLRRFIDYAATKDSLSVTLVSDFYIEAAITVCVVALPLLFLSLLVSVVATGAQTKFLFAQEALKPKFSRINPVEGFKRMFSLRSFVELIKGLLKIVILVVIVYRFLVGRAMPLAKTLFMNLEQSTTYILSSVITLVVQICIVFVCVAALDFVYQRWDYERRIKMSKHEVKEEYKQLEGDPQVKRRIRDVQMKFAMSRMMQAVPTADVVIKNPTHYAVALKYDMEQDMAPVLVAKGQDEMALMIIKVAEEHNVFITENKPLAQALYASIDLNREISAEFYDTVAEILALLYRMNNRKM